MPPLSTILAVLASLQSTPSSPPSFEPAGTESVGARIPSAGLAIDVSARGLEIRPTASVPWVSEPEWHVTIRTTGVGRGGELDTSAPEPAVAAGSRAELQRAGWVEWFETTERGVRQGWTVAQRPGGDRGSRLRIGIEFEGDLVPYLADGGGSVVLKNRLQEPVMQYVDLRAWDAAGRELEAHIRPSPWGIGIEVDDREALYPVTVDPVATPATWTWTGPDASAAWHADSLVRVSCSTAGDVNGDGFSDVIVGIPARGNGAGSVALFFGSASGPAVAPSWTAVGPESDGCFGASVACAGNVNNDPYDDIVVGAPREAGGNGRLYVWLGASTGPAAAADFTFTSSNFGFLGASVAGAGKLDGDNFDDIVVGAPKCANGDGNSCNNSPAAARVVVFFGSASGPTATPWSTSLNHPPNTGLGWCVASAGDVNGDGFDDIAASAPWMHSPANDAGEVYVFHGSPGFASDFTPDWIRPGLVQTERHFGHSIAGVGDLNGDTYADFAIGAHHYPNSGGQDGRVFVFSGGPAGLSSMSSGDFEGTSSHRAYGAAVAAAGDVDGDGFADFVVGSPGPDSNDLGAVSVIHGRALPFGTVTGPGDQSIFPATGKAFGCSVSGAGDVDGDGLTDVVVGGLSASGGSPPVRAYAFLGRLSTPGAEPQTSIVGAPGYTLGNVIASAGMVDSTGNNARTDFLIGVPDANGGDGQVQLRLGLISGIDAGAAVWTSPPLGTGARAGSAVAAGDVNNDGNTDVLIGCPQFGNGQANEGRAVLFRGTASGDLTTTPIWTYESDVPNAQFGSSAAFAGDINGDGYSDVLIGAPGDSTGGANAGSVYVFLGGVNGSIASTPLRIIRGGAGWRLGSSVSTAGDVNRDGFSDLLIGSPDYANGQVLEGRVDLYLGTRAGVTALSNWTVELNQANARLGAAIAAAGDVNNDGYADVVLGSAFWTALQGRAFVYHGGPGGPPIISLTLGTTLLGATGQPANTEFGASVAGAGDVNGDGFADILVGSPDDDVGAGNGADRGSVTLYYGSSAGIVATGAESHPGSTNGGFFGRSVAGAGDLNADGFSDFGGGAPGGSGGSIGLFAGGGITGTRVNTHQRRHDDLNAVDLLGRSESTTSFQTQNYLFNSGGVPGTPMGRARVRLQWENDVLSALFDGQGLDPQVVTWEDVTLHPIGTPFQGSVTGLSIDNSYHWRARFCLRNPFLPHTRWLTLPGNAREEKKLGTGLDCNSNGVPDSQDLGQPGILDCNGNLSPDTCDLASGSSLDCNGSGVPDDCELVANDCDADGVPDTCQLAASDCNANQQVDSCDIAFGVSQDTNGDGRPDECQTFVTNFCPGDGFGTPCPCSNHSVPGAVEGCLSSLGIGGRLRGSGVPSVAADNFVLNGTQMPNSSALYFQGTSQSNFGNGAAFGDGLRCAAGAVIRLGTKVNAANASSYPVAGDPSISVRGQIPPAGGQRYYQCWYRNAASFCTPSTFNLTNGVSVNWAP